MDEKKTSSSISFFGLLGIAFIILKLTKVIKWSWLWVLCPLWAPVALVIIFLFFYVIIGLITGHKADKENNELIEEAKAHRKYWVQDRFKFPEEEKPITFLVNKTWHHGVYKDCQFRIVGTKKYFDSVDVWYYL